MILKNAWVVSAVYYWPVVQTCNIFILGGNLSENNLCTILFCLSAHFLLFPFFPSLLTFKHGVNLKLDGIR